jgi:hypothetical protein
MFLSPAECFIVGRLAAAWMSHVWEFEPLRAKFEMAVSLLRVLNTVFNEFGLDRPGPPKEWWDRADDIPGDVIWRESAEVKRSNEYMSTDEGFPGIPAVAIGVSPSEPGTLFLERRDGRICGWRVELPRSGLYGLLLRRLRPMMGLSPQVWLMLHDEPWQKVADDWRGLPDFDPSYPHAPFMPDPPADVVGTLAAIAEEVGHTSAFRLGQTSGTVEYELWRLAGEAGCRPLLWTTFRRIRVQDVETVIEAFHNAQQVLRSPEAEEAAGADHLVASLYRTAERDLKKYEGEFEHILMLTMGIMLAHGLAGRASMYLYGRVYAAAE